MCPKITELSHRTQQWGLLGNKEVMENKVMENKVMENHQYDI